MEIITLRIKRKFFNQIQSGEKRTEYRADTDYYQRLFERHRDARLLILHWQSMEKLVCRIEGIRKIRNPFGNEHAFLATPLVWAISISKPTFFKNTSAEIREKL